MTFLEFFAGVGGFRLGLEKAGHTCVGACEIDPKAREVYAARFGSEPEYEDITAIEARSLPKADLWVGGFPCQDVSIAGAGKGIEEGTRSGLWLTWSKLVAVCRPPWLFIENVPGLLSNRGGQDFRTVLRTLDELGYVGAWRVLDAQFFGVPQRRRRVFIVACRAGVGDPRAVLFEPEGVCRDLATGGAQRADVARCLTAGAASGSRYDGDTETFVSVDVARPLKAKANDSHDESHDTYVAQCHGSNVGPMGALRVGNGNVTGGVPFIADVPAVAGTLGGGSGSRGWCNDLDCSGAFIPFVKTHRATSDTDVEIWRQNDTAPTLNEGDCRDVRTPVAVAFNSFAESGNGGNGYTEDATPPVRGSNPPAIGFDTLNQTLSHVSPCLRNPNGTFGDGVPAVHTDPAHAVRRLTPTECERLQGFPDGWTCLCGVRPYSTSACKCKDGYRYKQMGNAVAVPVIEWIGCRFPHTAKGPKTKK